MSDPTGHVDDEDVVALLMRQHGQIRNLFDEAERATGDERREAFQCLVRLLAMHETAEEEIVHPLARTTHEGAGDVVDQRLKEEREAKEHLSRMEDMDIADASFPAELATLRRLVMAHARAEERYEFMHLRRFVDPERLRSMANAVKSAESLAPTHPHPGIESAKANVLLGPMAAITDRTRDAIRKAMGRNG
ncbi:hemerythrin domain-containing protein [Actinopolymorpha sp. B11F2]|uniref:hemerythrin domain-containing protein n=1 Tax=Actinopolymorpha sp. B11F2 TaxID=3160862 RepID=UPI0032E46DA2